eukprot:scaffold169557_cov58-Attheya_sp.AAC.1
MRTGEVNRFQITIDTRTDSHHVHNKQLHRKVTQTECNDSTKDLTGEGKTNCCQSSETGRFLKDISRWHKRNNNRKILT